MTRRVGVNLALAMLLVFQAGGSAAQTAPPPTTSERPPPPAPRAETDDPDAGDPRFTDAELDGIVAPVALYPDSLLTQIFVAATYPLDVVKAERLLGGKTDMTAEARADAVEGEDWDPSVRMLAAGFPTVIDRMAEDLDWTQDLGNAVALQTDDVLAAVQRMRADAREVGNLGSNDAQVVEVQGDTISIAPAKEGTVYVPTYDPDTVYTQPAATAPVVADPGYTGTDMLMTGAIAFGGAFLINEIFDDDDDWDDYWRGPPRIDWDDGEFNPRPDVNIDGDVTINRGRFNDFDRQDGGIGDGRIGDRADGMRPAGWKPSPARQAEARQQVAARKGDHAGANRDVRARIDGARAGRPAVAAAPGASPKPRAQAPQRPREIATHATPKKAADVHRPVRTSKPVAHREPPKKTAFQKSGHRPQVASQRGHASRGGGHRR